MNCVKVHQVGSRVLKWCPSDVASRQETRCFADVPLPVPISFSIIPLCAFLRLLSCNTRTYSVSVLISDQHLILSCNDYYASEQTQSSAKRQAPNPNLRPHASFRQLACIIDAVLQPLPPHHRLAIILSQQTKSPLAAFLP